MIPGSKTHFLRFYALKAFAAIPFTVIDDVAITNFILFHYFFIELSEVADERTKKTRFRVSIGPCRAVLVKVPYYATTPE